MSQADTSALCLQYLYEPELVTIRVGKDCAIRDFKVPRGLICSQSAYFDKAFQSTFKEGEEGIITLKEVKHWVFECFVGWLYTNRVFWDPAQDKVDPAGPKENPECKNKKEHENLHHDPVTWDWLHLINLYLFADQYDIKRLRNTLMAIAQTKGFQKTPRNYTWPSVTVLAIVFKNLTSNSPLYKFMIDAIVYHIAPGPMAETKKIESLPSAALASILTKAIQLQRASCCEACRTKNHCSNLNHRDIKRSGLTFCLQSMPLSRARYRGGTQTLQSCLQRPCREAWHGLPA